MRVVQTPASRANDPVSSYEAEQELNASGRRTLQQRAAYQLVCEHPNCTSDELAMFGALDRYQLARRLPELETGGYVERGSLRKSTKTGRSGCTWHPKRAQMKLL